MCDLAAHGYISGLLEAGFPVTWTPVTGGHRWSRFYSQPFSGPRIGDPLLDPICNKRMEYDKVLLHLTPEYIPFWRKREPEKILIGYSVWETSHLPRHWPDLLNQLNALLVPCQWNREVFAQSGVRIPIHVIPHLLEEASPPSFQAFAAECSDRFVFLWNLSLDGSQGAVENHSRISGNLYRRGSSAPIVENQSSRFYARPLGAVYFPYRIQPAKAYVTLQKSPTRYAR